jgi:hypothetical protein
MMRPAVEIRFESVICGHGDLRNAPFSLALIGHSNRVSAKIRFGLSGNAILRGRDKGAETTPEVLPIACRD